MNNELKIGFIGFGEAGFHIANGLRREGLKSICAFDIHTHTPGRGEKIQLRAREAGVHLCETNEEISVSCDILLSTVTANQALEAAKQNSGYLDATKIYADLNSVSPDLKRTISTMIEAGKARFVEVAIMSPVPPHGHRVPMYLGGRNAKELADVLSPYGMNLEIISDEIGSASAVKMCRSIIVKGLEALLLECVLGAVPYGADERVFASLEESMPGMNWQRMASYMVGRVIEHGERRARELEEVAVTLRAIGVEPLMTEAIVKRQDWGAGLAPLFGGKAPEDYHAVVEAVRARDGKKGER